MQVRAGLNWQKGELDAARSDLQRALEINQWLFGPRHGVTADSWSQLGELEQSRKDYAAARRCLSTALDINRERFGPSNSWAVGNLGLLTQLDFLARDYPVARRHLEEYLPLRVALTRDVLGTLSEAEALAFVENSPGASTFLSLLRNLPEEGESAERIYEIICTTRSQATRLLAARRVLARSNPATRVTRERLTQVRQQLAALAFAGATRAEELTQLSQEKEMLERAPGRAGMPARDESAFAAVHPADLAARLPRDVAIVEFDTAQVLEPTAQPGDEPTPVWHYEAFILRHGHAGATLQWVHLGRAEPVADAARAFRRQIADYDKPRHDNTQAAAHPERTLRKELWDPIEPHLAGCTTVIVIPEDALTMVPWAALPGRNPATYLVEDYALATAGHLEQIQGLLGREPAQGEARLLVGGVAYDQTPAVVAETKARPRRGPALVDERMLKWEPLPGHARRDRRDCAGCPDGRFGRSARGRQGERAGAPPRAAARAVRPPRDSWLFRR